MKYPTRHLKKLLHWSQEKPLALNTVVVILIGILTLTVQYSESKVGDFQNELQLLQNSANNLLIKKIDLLAQGNLSQLYNLHGVQSGTQMGGESPYADTELVALALQFQNGEIPISVYFTKRTEIYYKKANEARDQYNEKLLVLNERLNQGTNWTIVNIISYSLLLPFIFISSLLNVLLYRKKF